VAATLLVTDLGEKSANREGLFYYWSGQENLSRCDVVPSDMGDVFCNLVIWVISHDFSLELVGRLVVISYGVWFCFVIE
jgi:hypothetical protein